MIPNTLQRWSEQIVHAAAVGSAITIRGAGSKQHYGNAGVIAQHSIETSEWSGMVAYDPDELVLTARAGTPLAEIDAALAAHGQMLAFEPPRFGAQGTLGGCVASGLAGPRRPYGGAVRDSVLGLRMLDGQGRQLRFGGQVVKNVAGFDVARCMTGSLGTLGLLTEISLKLAPRPRFEATLVLTMHAAEALQQFNLWRRSNLPISASAWIDDRLYLRLAGSAGRLAAMSAQLNASLLADDAAFWRALRDHAHPCFAPQPDAALLRLSVRADAPLLPMTHHACIEWAGALRWVWAEVADIAALRDWASLHGGHASVFRAAPDVIAQHGAFTALPASHLALLQRIKAVFDPAAVFQPGRLYPTL